MKRFLVTTAMVLVVSGLVHASTYLDGAGTTPTLDGNNTYTGVNNFMQRPTVNGTNVLLQGEASIATWGAVVGSISAQLDLWAQFTNRYTKAESQALTNGLAAIDWVNIQTGNVWQALLNKNYVTQTVTNGLAATDWVNIQTSSVWQAMLNKNYVTQTVTNGLAATDWVNIQTGSVWEATTNWVATHSGVETDPVFTNWLATNGVLSATNDVVNGYALFASVGANYTSFYWGVVSTTETDPVFSTNGATKAYADGLALTNNAQRRSYTVLTDDASHSVITTDVSTVSFYKLTLQGNRTLANPINAVDGQRIEWKVYQGTGTNVLTFGSKFRLPGSSGLSSITCFTAKANMDRLAVEYVSSDDKFDITAFVAGYTNAP